MNAETLYWIVQLYIEAKIILIHNNIKMMLLIFQF